MQLTFLNREQELRYLKRVFSSQESTFCCLYGRRRFGKSRLLQEALPRNGSVYYVSDEREAPLQRQAVATAMATILPGLDRVQYPDWESLLERWWKESPRGTILTFDEFPYLVQTSPELPSILQRLLDQYRTKGMHFVICGSSQRMMQGLVLDSSAPLYGRAQEIIQVKSLGAFWLTKALNLSDPIDIWEAYSVWGGVPRYWELANDFRSTWDAITELVLNPLGVLHQEPIRLLLDDMRETAQAASLLSLIGAGCRRISEIAGRLGKPATSLNRPMQRILELNLIRRELPFSASLKTSKKTIYRIADPFLAFWLRYVEPNRSRLAAGAVKSVMQDTKKNYAKHVSEIWEELTRQAIAHLPIEGMEWLPAQRWWGPNSNRMPMELDIVTESVDKNILLVGEAKLRLQQKEIHRIENELTQKVSALPFAKHYKRVVLAVFVASEQNLKPTKSVNLVPARKILSVLK